MKNNPFNLTFGKEPVQMISRISQSAEIIENFTSENPGQQVYMITGVRGSGKTVFMTSIQKQLQKDDAWIVTELNSSGDLLNEFVSRLYNIKGMPKKFAADGINLSFWGLGVNIKKEDPITDPVTALERMLDRIVKDKKKILITIDEVFGSPEMKYFAGTLQMLIRHDYPVYVIMTGLYENINRLQNEENLTFLYRAPKIYLSALNTYRIAEHYEMIPGISKDIAVEMARLTRGYPFAFQVFGYFTYNKGDFQKCLSEIKNYLYEYVYDKLWIELSEKEKNLLKLIAEKSMKDVKSLRETFNSGSNEFSMYRDRLIKKGILNGSRRGYLDFTLPFFEDYIRELNDDYDLEISSKLSSLVRETPCYIDKNSDIAVVRASTLKEILTEYYSYAKKRKDISESFSLMSEMLDIEIN